MTMYFYNPQPMHLSKLALFLTFEMSFSIHVVEICQYFIDKHHKLSSYLNWSIFIFHSPGQASQHLFPGLLRDWVHEQQNSVVFHILRAWPVAGTQGHRKRVCEWRKTGTPLCSRSSWKVLWGSRRLVGCQKEIRKNWMGGGKT